MKFSHLFSRIVYVTLLCSVLCFQWSVQNEFAMEIPQTVVKALRQQAEVCSKETGVPATHLKKVIDQTLANEKPNRDFFFCVVYNQQYFDENGHAFTDKYASFNFPKGTKDDLVNTFNECNKIVLEDNAATAFGVAECIRKKYDVIVLN